MNNDDKNNPVITIGYLNNKNNFYKNLKNISFKKEGLLNIGKFITDSKKEPNPFFDNMLEGVYIYQSNINPNVAYRIYKEFSEYHFNGYNDDKLVSNLIEKQQNIKLTDFPTGIVTLNNNIIGQEIPYYDNSETLLEHAEKVLEDSKEVIPTNYYIQILKILKEMYVNKIYYFDIHPKNFIITKENIIKLIDFDDSYIEFGESNDEVNKMIFINLSNLINILNSKFLNKRKIKKINYLRSFDEYEDKILTMDYRLNK